MTITKCQCEHGTCEKGAYVDGRAHVAGACPRDVGKARVRHLGPVCDSCVAVYRASESEYVTRDEQGREP